jgi:hypothetical protein
MRPNGLCILATLALVSPAMLTAASAQMRRGGGAPAAAPHIAAPAPHIAAPAPRMAAPAPHIAAPAPHFSAPRVAAPQMAPRVSAPRMASPHFSAPRAAPRVASPHINARQFASPRTNPHINTSRSNAHVANTSRSNAHVATPRVNAPAINSRNAGVTGPNANRTNRNALAPATNGNRAGTAVGNAERLRGRNPPTTVGQGPGQKAAAALRGARPGARSNHILRNAALSNPSPRDPAARALSNSTFRGRFAQSNFARDFGRDRRHHHHFGFVLGFVGPVFWPYAYDDFVDYTFWPSAYDTFWPYAYDDVFEGIYGGYAPEYGAAYAYAGAQASSRAYERGGAGGGGGGRGGQGLAATQICSGDAGGLTDFPIEQISRQVQPTQDQQALLNDLKAATDKAVQILQTACPNDLPATPTGRLAAMRMRVQAMLQAVQTVRPALDKFYGSLSDEQKERFNALDQGTAAATAQNQADQVCGGQKSSIVNLPVGRIEQSLRLNDRQEAALRDVGDASAKAADILNAACPNGQAQEMLTPPGRIAAMEQRLDAMLQAIETVRPALTRFYGSLSDEQKARFDRMGRQST